MFPYSANVVEPIMLLDELIRLDQGDTASYKRVREGAWAWLMKYPMQNNVWVGYFEDVTANMQNMNQVIRVIEASANTDDILKNNCFDIDGEAFKRNAEATVYGRRFTRYLLIKLDYFYQDHAHRMAVDPGEQLDLGACLLDPGGANEDRVDRLGLAGQFDLGLERGDLPSDAPTPRRGRTCVRRARPTPNRCRARAADG